MTRRRAVTGAPLGGAPAGGPLCCLGGEGVLRAAEAGLGQEEVVAVLTELLLVPAARVVRHDPVDLAVDQVGPERLDVLARPQRRVDLAADAVGGVAVGEQVADGDLT